MAAVQGRGVFRLPQSLSQLSVSALSLSVISTDRQRVVAGDEEDVEDGGGGEVAGQQAARVGEHGLGVDQREDEEGDGPDPVEYLNKATISHREVTLSSCHHISESDGVNVINTWLLT